MPVIKKMGQSRISRDKDDVKKVLSTLNTWVNPFKEAETSEVWHLASGIKANEKLEEDLLAAHAKGKLAYVNFIQKRLTGNEVGFFEPIPRLKLESFSNNAKSIKVSSQDVPLKFDRDLFARLVVIAQSREMDLRDVFTYSLGPLPWSIASTDGTLGKTDKSKLVEVLTSDIPPAEDIRPTAAWIVDGMAIFQSLKEIPVSFKDLATTVFDKVTAHVSLARRIDFVTDRYPEVSVKNAERARRKDHHGSIKIKIKGPAQKCPKQWKKFLSDGENKELTEFILQEWSKDAYAVRIGERVIYFACKERCYKLYVRDGEVKSGLVNELQCTHEEADTRLLLHAKHATDHGEHTVIIRSPDSDVVVLACHFQDRIPAHLLIQKTSKTRTYFFDIRAIYENLGGELCSALPGLHSFTGCDTTSCFAGKGKKGPLKILMADKESQEAMCMLGNSYAISSTVTSLCQKFVCKIYGMPKLHDVDECGYQLFCTKNKQSHNLPPCKDALTKHILRANYQAVIWRRAIQAEPHVPGPDGYGWLVSDDGLVTIDWMSLLNEALFVSQLWSLLYRLLSVW